MLFTQNTRAIKFLDNILSHKKDISCDGENRPFRLNRKGYIYPLFSSKMETRNQEIGRRNAKLSQKKHFIDCSNGKMKKCG